MSRREFLTKLTGAGAAAFLMDWAAPVIEKAYGAGPCPGHLTDIEHIVLLMQENRSFDHYFGTLSSTNGFNAASPAFQQMGWNPMTQALDPAGVTIPFRLARYGIAPTYPGDFAADVRANRLPKVSWLVPNILQSEHPALPVALGAVSMVTALRILLSNPAVWEKTALIVSYDENGGFFDHVTPPTAPPGTPGEFVTVPNIDAVPGSGGIRGPLGLGFRVPCIVISPYSRGPLMVSDTFDHTSQLKLIRARFGVPVPNMTAWRDGVVGDMTSAFNFAAPPNSTRPNLSHPLLGALPKLPQCIPNVVLGTTDGALPSIPYRVPYPQVMPTQETTPVRGTPSGLCS